MRADGLLDAADVVRRQPSQHVARRRDRPGVIRVQAEWAVTDRGAHLAHHLELLVQPDRRELALERRRVVLLDHARAVARDLERRRLARMRRAGVAQREVLGERDFAPHGSAQQEVQRFALRPPAQIPERHLDRTEGAAQRRHVLPQRVLEGRHAAALALVEIERVEPGQAFAQAGDVGAAIAVGALADARHALVRVDLDDRLRDRRRRPEREAIGRVERDVHGRRAYGSDAHPGDPRRARRPGARGRRAR